MSDSCSLEWSACLKPETWDHRLFYPKHTRARMQSRGHIKRLVYIADEKPQLLPQLHCALVIKLES